MNKMLTTLALLISFTTVGLMISADAPVDNKTTKGNPLVPNDPPEGPPY